MKTINDIVEIKTPYGGRAYRGKLRNEDIFDMHQIVFCALGNSEVLFNATVVGIEYTEEENPNYLYTLRIPDGLGYKNAKLPCSFIFASIEDARKNAYEHLEDAHNQAKKRLEDYFKQFES